MATSFSSDQINDWKNRIVTQRSSGESITTWCRKHQVVVHQFYYWQAKLFPKSIDRKTFTEVVLKEDIKSGITLECGNYRIHLDPAFDTVTLKKCLEVLVKC